MPDAGAMVRRIVGTDATEVRSVYCYWRDAFFVGSKMVFPLELPCYLLSKSKLSNSAQTERSRSSDPPDGAPPKDSPPGSTQSGFPHTG